MYYNYSDLNYINQELAGVWPGWTALKLLGKGSFGAVYEIHRNVRGNLEKAAMKVLRVPENDAEIARLRFQGVSWQNTEEYYENYVDSIQNEIRIMQRFVGNSHIVSYEDYSIRKRPDQIGWDLYIRMELLTGLLEYTETHPFDEKTIVRMGMDIAQGLRDCHNKGIIHRDVKPENIFVNESGNFKLGDFGVSRSAPGSQDVLSFKGTLDYMAPEIYRMLSTDERSDIYSLGMVLYQFLNGNRMPFVPEKVTQYDLETARQRRFAGEPIPAPAHGSQRLKSAVLRAVDDKPENRFQTAEDMYLELMEVYRIDYSSERVAQGIAATELKSGGIKAAGITGSGQKPDRIGAIYQNTDQPTVKQKTLEAEYFDISAVNKGSDAISQEQHSQEQYSQDQNLQNQYPQDQPVEKKPFPLLSVAVAAGVLALVLVVAGIAVLIRNNVDFYGPGQAAHSVGSTQIAGAEETGQMSQITGEESEESAEEDKKNDGEAAAEQKDASEEEKFTDYAIDWKDPVLEERMRKKTGIKSGDIMYSDVKNIIYLDFSVHEVVDNDAKIKDISALSSLTNLKYLNLRGNEISDISKISNLTSLEKVDLSSNQISDISALGGLTDLLTLYLYNNQINDISALGGLTNLTELSLHDNQISDISALGGMTNLRTLILDSNQISDISAIEKLTNLTELYLYKNQISDISPISNLTNLTTLNIRNNPISDYSPIEDLNIEKLYK